MAMIWRRFAAAPLHDIGKIGIPTPFAETWKIDTEEFES